MIGVRVGIAVGTRAGAAIGINADPLAPDGGDPLAGVTKDTASGWFFPATAGEWAAVMATAGIASGGPSVGSLCQEASGNLADSIDAVTLTQSGVGHLYQQPVTGFTRKAVRTVDGVAGQKWINSTTAPNPNLVSTIWLVAVNFPAIAPLANRDLIANSAALDVRLNATSRIAIVNGGTTVGAANPIGTTQWIAAQHNLTSSEWLLYSLQEKITGVFAAVASNPMEVLGGQTAAPADTGYMANYIFAGIAAELTQAQMRSLFQTLTRDAVVPVLIPW